MSSRILELAGVVSSSLLCACAAPPMGLGTGAMQVAAPGSTGMLAAGSTGMAASGSRTVFQAEASVVVHHRPANLPGGGIEAGIVYTQLSERRGDEEVFVVGGFPYVRPRLSVGPATMAMALSGFGIGAGGGGLIGGIADVQLGLGSRTSSFYVGAFTQVFDVTGGNRTVAKQLRAGGEHMWQLRGARLGLALEIYSQDDAFVTRPPEESTKRGMRVNSSFTAIGIKLRIDRAGPR